MLYSSFLFILPQLLLQVLQLIFKYGPLQSSKLTLLLELCKIPGQVFALLGEFVLHMDFMVL